MNPMNDEDLKRFEAKRSRNALNFIRGELLRPRKELVEELRYQRYIGADGTLLRDAMNRFLDELEWVFKGLE